MKSDVVPYGADYLVRRLDDLEVKIREMGAARSLAASQIGNGGTLKVDGTLQVTGDLEVPDGVLSSSGAMTAGTTVTAGTDVHAGGDLIADDDLHVGDNANIDGDINLDGDLYTPHGRATPVVTSYVSAYINSDGRVGATPSARKFKVDIHPKQYTLEQIAQVELVAYRLQAAVEELGDDAIPEFGVIAEQLLDVGLDEFVIRDAEGDPFSVAYDRLALLGIAGVQALSERVTQLENLIQSHLGGLPEADPDEQ